MKISGVYQIINIITGDCYIGSSVDLKRRKKEHFKKSTWKKESNKPLYKYMQQYGKENFLFKTIQLCDPEELKKYEQIAIEKYNPKYNIRVAYTGITGLSKEEYKKQYNKEYADKIRQQKKQYRKEHADSIKQYRKEHIEEYIEYRKQYNKENADSIKQQQKQYYNQKCLYENEILSLGTLSARFSRQGIEHPTLEAKKYLI